MMSVFAMGLPGGWEWMAIFIIVFLLFGAKKLPELARGIGKSLGEFRKAREEFDQELRSSTEKGTQPEEPKRSVDQNEGGKSVDSPESKA